MNSLKNTLYFWSQLNASAFLGLYIGAPFDQIFQIFLSFYIFLIICLKYCLWGRTFMYLFEIQILYKHIPDETKLFFFLPFLLWDVYSDWNKQSKVPSFSCLPIPFVLVILKRHFGDDAL